jgi:hypothetical protein
MITWKTPRFLAIAIGTLLALGVLTACSLLAPEASFAPTHPEKLGAGRPICATCHGEEQMKGAAKAYASFDHTPAFVKDHKFAAGRDAGTCSACHSQSFCADCHGGRTMISPATKLGNRPDRATPHPANFLALHRVEGKLDPTSCFKCHGRANNERCTTCHK